MTYVTTFEYKNILRESTFKVKSSGALFYLKVQICIFIWGLKKKGLKHVIQNSKPFNLKSKYLFYVGNNIFTVVSWLQLSVRVGVGSLLNY